MTNGGNGGSRGVRIIGPPPSKLCGHKEPKRSVGLSPKLHAASIMTLSQSYGAIGIATDKTGGERVLRCSNISSIDSPFRDAHVTLGSGKDASTRIFTARKTSHPLEGQGCPVVH